MSNVIEIYDSDDETSGALTSANAELTQPKGEMEETEKEEAAVSEVANAAATTEEPKDNSRSPDPTSNATTSSPVKRRSRRKSTLQSLRASPEMEFETVTVNTEVAQKTTEESIPPPPPPVVSKEIPKPKTSSSHPNILTPKTMGVVELVDAAFDNFLDTNDEVKALIRAIASERVRINYLLSQSSMPEINFSLYTQIEMIKFQLEDRIKQRKLHDIEALRVHITRRNSKNVRVFSRKRTS